MTLIVLFISYSLILGGLWAFALEQDGHEILFPALHDRLRSVVAKLLSVGALIGGTLLGIKAIQTEWREILDTRHRHGRETAEHVP